MPVTVLALSGGLLGGVFEGIRNVVETATGPLGLVIILVYSFLITFILPLPSEVVLVPAGHLRLGVELSYTADLAIIILISSTGKAAGSLVAFYIGQEAKSSGPVERWLRRSRFDILEWSEKKTVQLVQKYGYVGMALALSVPGFPDTISVYAFSILEEDYVKFAAATFTGSVGRFLVFIGAVGGAFVIV